MAHSFPSLPPTLLIISLKIYFPPARTLNYLRALLDPQNDIVRPQNRSLLLLSLIPDFLTVYPCSEIIRDHFARAGPLPPPLPLTDPVSSSTGTATTTTTTTTATTTAATTIPPPFLLGAQDCFWEDLGAYTGEVSPLALKDLNVSIVELGHSERRSIFGETDLQTARKAAAVCNHGMIPLVCVGEVTPPGPVASEAVGRAVDECAVQVRAVLDAIPGVAPVIFAYEPVWAIGKPVPAGVDHVSGVVDGIRAVVRGVGRGGNGKDDQKNNNTTSKKRDGDVRVLYGGSAGPGLWTKGGLGKAVDGMFLGRFAHEVDGVRKIVREVEESLGVA